MKTGQIHLGCHQDCRTYLSTVRGYYVYVLRRPDGRPFYVGKGVGDRVLAHENEARHPNDWRSNAYKLNVIRSIWKAGGAVQYEIDFVTEDEVAAYAREAELISGLKRLHEGGPLTNLAAGGGSILGPSPVSKEKHSVTLAGRPDDNPERAVLNGFVLSIARMNSVVVKPSGQFRARPTQRFPSATRVPSLRQAVALIASAASNGINLDAACCIPRRLSVQGVDGLVENGVACDIMTSGMATIIPAKDPAGERFHLTVEQCQAAVGFVGRKKCFDLGIISDV